MICYKVAEVKTISHIFSQPLSRLMPNILPPGGERQRLVCSLVLRDISFVLRQIELHHQRIAPPGDPVQSLGVKPRAHQMCSKHGLKASWIQMNALRNGNGPFCIVVFCAAALTQSGLWSIGEQDHISNTRRERFKYCCDHLQSV